MSKSTNAVFAFIAGMGIAMTACGADKPIIDTDLAPPAPGPVREVPLELRADRESLDGRTGGIAVHFEIVRGGETEAVRGLRVRLRGGAGERELTTGNDGSVSWEECDSRANLQGEAELETSRFAVTDGRRPYRIVFEVRCGQRLSLSFDAESDAGQAVSVFNTGIRGETRLDSAVGLDFWNSKLRFVYPSNGDYYSWGRVHVTRGDHWDVVGHELGHGIYDLAGIGRFGGGRHFIDRCYDETLALSEGWASFFSAWIHLDLADNDAKFEFLVPRRAPIRIEHIPDDVCDGPTNEWRVTGFLWDLIDLNADEENADEAFARLWSATHDSHVRSASAAAERFVSAGMDRAIVELVWELNFRKRWNAH